MTRIILPAGQIKASTATGLAIVHMALGQSEDAELALMPLTAVAPRALPESEFWVGLGGRIDGYVFDGRLAIGTHPNGARISTATAVWDNLRDLVLDHLAPALAGLTTAERLQVAADTRGTLLAAVDAAATGDLSTGSHVRSSGNKVFMPTAVNLMESIAEPFQVLAKLPASERLASYRVSYWLAADIAAASIESTVRHHAEKLLVPRMLLNAQRHNERVLVIPAAAHIPWLNYIWDVPGQKAWSSVVYRDAFSDHWVVHQIPAGKKNRAVSRRRFPAGWEGLEGEALVAASGIAGAVSVHPKRWLATATTLEAALAMADQAQ